VETENHLAWLEEISKVQILNSLFKDTMSCAVDVIKDYSLYDAHRSDAEADYFSNRVAQAQREFRDSWAKFRTACSNRPPTLMKEFAEKLEHIADNKAYTSKLNTEFYDLAKDAVKQWESIPSREKARIYFKGDITDREKLRAVRALVQTHSDKTQKRISESESKLKKRRPLYVEFPGSGTPVVELTSKPKSSFNPFKALWQRFRPRRR